MRPTVDMMYEALWGKGIREVQSFSINLKT